MIFLKFLGKFKENRTQCTSTTIIIKKIKSNSDHLTKVLICDI